MCGIAGFKDKSKLFVDIEKMTTALSHRGPDDHGYYLHNDIALGHRRLSIIDLSCSGHQPMYFENLALVYNGEIYNFKEIRAELEKNGYHFQSSSDTEVVIKAFHCWRVKCVDKFIGMFAFAILDKTENALYLFRDRAGVKPLYYFKKNNRFAFASELKALKDYLNKEEKLDLNPFAISSFFRYGYISNHRSIIQHVSKLPPAHYLIYKNSEATIHQYWSVDFIENNTYLERNEEDILDELESIIVSAFQYRMVSDVPVGLFLSAGVDSSLVASVLSKHYGHINTFTIGFAEKDFDESTDARRIAAYLNTTHYEGILNPQNAQEILDCFYDIYDEPHGDNSCVPTTFVSALAKSKGVKVVLSADGGDELFGGYSRYTASLNRWKQIQKIRQLPKRFLKLALIHVGKIMSPERSYTLDRFSSILAQKSFGDFYQTILRPNSDKELQQLLSTDLYSPDQVEADNLYNQMMEWDFYHYLPDDILVKVDRATMYHNIEGREPFLDHRLIEFAAKLPIDYKIKNGVTKYLLKKLLQRYLPKQLYDLPKRGFGAPIQQWLRNDLEKEIESTFSPSYFQNDYLNRTAVFNLIKRYKQDKNVNMITIWYLYSFQKWYNKWLKND